MEFDAALPTTTPAQQESRLRRDKSAAKGEELVAAMAGRNVGHSQRKAITDALLQGQLDAEKAGCMTGTSNWLACIMKRLGDVIPLPPRSEVEARQMFEKVAGPLGYDLNRTVGGLGLWDHYTEATTERAFKLYQLGMMPKGTVS